jgi:hypothetical protein
MNPMLEYFQSEACDVEDARRFPRHLFSMDFIKQPTLDFPVGSNAAVRLRKYLEQSKDYALTLYLFFIAQLTQN